MQLLLLATLALAAAPAHAQYCPSTSLTPHSVISPLGGHLWAPLASLTLRLFRTHADYGDNGGSSYGVRVGVGIGSASPSPPSPHQLPALHLELTTPPFARSRRRRSPRHPARRLPHAPPACTGFQSRVPAPTVELPAVAGPAGPERVLRTAVGISAAVWAESGVWGCESGCGGRRSGSGRRLHPTAAAMCVQVPLSRSVPR